jgi:hypothetical protein
MSRMLAIFSVAGLALCACFLSAAFWIGGDDIFRNPGAMRGMKPLIDMATRKEWRWQGGDTLALNAPVNVRYEPRGAPGISVTGPADMMKNVRVSEGRIASNAPARSNGRKLEAVVSGVSIRKFVVNGGENLQLGKIDQDALDVHLNGSGTVSGEGRVGQLNLMIAGPGSADLGKLSVTNNASVSILGNGDVALAPKGALRVFIAGNGHLKLTSTPKEISRTILGRGDIIAPSGTPLPPAPTVAVDVTVPMVADVQKEMVLPPQTMSDANIRANSETGDYMVHGSRAADFGHIERETAKISVMSSGSATAEGKVDRLQVNVMGSGRARLGNLAARDAAVTVAGSGSAVISATGNVKITILGSGNVQLLAKPERIDRHILGSGRIIEP